MSTDQPGEPKFNYRYPFQTRNGWPARLVGVLQRRAFPLVVAIRNPQFEGEEMHCYNLDGRQPSNFEYHQFKPTGTEGGPLSLVNLPWFDEADELTLQPNDFVHAVATHEREPMNLEWSSNPMNYDPMSMMTTLVRGWAVVHEGFDGEDNQRALPWVDLVNMRSGQWIHISLSTKKEKP